MMKIARTLMLGVAAAGLMISGAQAADPVLLPADPVMIYDDIAFSFEGFYIGVQGGGFFTDNFGDFDHTAGLIGIVAGANFLVSDAILAGLEFQGDVYFGGNTASSSGFSAADALILGRVGALVTDEVLIYAAAGVGLIGGTGFAPASETGAYYAIGGGAEVAVTDNLGIRGEVLYKHLFNNTTTGIDGSGVQATLGLLWHLN